MQPPKRTRTGAEISDPRSLVVAGQLRHVTLGERIRRYMRTPEFLQDQRNEEGYDPDDLEEKNFYDGEIVSIHDDRYKELEADRKKQEAAQREKEKEKLKAEEDAARETFRKRWKELQSEDAEKASVVVRSKPEPAPAISLPDDRENGA